MKTSPRLLLSALLLSSPVVLARDKPAEPASASAHLVQLQFRGSLHDAIEKIAEEGGLNVVVTGELNTPAQVHLSGIRAEEALRTVARAYSLKLTQQGSIYTLRPMTDEEKAAEVSAAPASPPTSEASNADEADEDEADEPSTAEALPSPPPPPEPMDPDHVKHLVREQLAKARHSGKGSRDVVARGASLEVQEGETVDSAVAYGGKLTVKGDVQGDAVVYGGDLEITGRVDGDASAFGGNVVLAPSAVVQGDVSAFGGSVVRQPGSTVHGEVASLGGANIGRVVAGELKKNLKEPDSEEASAAKEKERGHGFAFFVLEFAILFGMGFLGQLLFPARMKELGEEIRRYPTRSGIVGLLVVIALLPTLVVLTVTIIGIPLALALMLLVPLLTVLGFSAVASELGKKLPLMRGRKTQAMVLAMGLLVLLLLGRLPVLGPAVLTLAALTSLGAVTRTRFGHRPQGLPEPISGERVAL